MRPVVFAIAACALLGGMPTSCAGRKSALSPAAETDATQPARRPTTETPAGDSSGQSPVAENAPTKAAETGAPKTENKASSTKTDARVPAAPVSGAGNSPRDTAVWARAGKYMGVKKCKSCHRKKESGNQYAAWEKMKHAKAFRSLSSDDALRIGKGRGIANPRQSAACLECHVTGYGLPDDRFDRRFKKEYGVQCESCHGPGENHIKARKAAATAGTEQKDSDGRVIPGAGEIIANPDEKICRGCHNARSPNYKEFTFAEFRKKILHRDPRRTKRDG